MLNAAYHGVSRHGEGVIRIQRATANNALALIPLVAEYWRFEAIADFEPERVTVQIKRLLSDPGLGAGWIAYVEDVPVGYLFAVYVFSLEHLGVTAEIDELFVLPSERGKGIDTELLKVAESEFLRSGCTNVSLQLSRSNDAAARSIITEDIKRDRRMSFLIKHYKTANSQFHATGYAGA